MKNRTRWMLAVAATAGMVACGPGRDADADRKDPIEEAASDVEREMQEFRTKAMVRLDTAAAKIEQLRAKARSASANTKARIDSEIVQLEDERNRLASRLQEMRADTKDAWNNTKNELDKSLDDLEDGIKRVVD